MIKLTGQKKTTVPVLSEIYLSRKFRASRILRCSRFRAAYDISTGASSDIESAMIDATKASTAIETTVQLTTRAVNAYKEIMSMQV